MNRAMLELAADLHRRHRPFVMATVVWARGPSSGKQGAVALIESDGTMHGWIGGACAEPAVLSEARRVLNDGSPALMYLGPPEELDGHRRDGVVTIPIACSSEGALEVFMEPVLPEPHVVVIGGSPAVGTLVGLLGVLGWQVTEVDDVDDLATTEIHDTTAVVVATQGHYDEPALEAVLETDAPYVGLVSSGKRAETVLGYLRDRGVSEDRLARIHTPAGLDLGRIEHREIAVAILAQLVAIRASGGLSGAARVVEAATAIDPVCAMTVDIEGARFTLEHDGEMFYFCAPGCRAAFEKQPAAFLGA
jgi:xanthine dehydrogenase accessory factor